MGCNCDIALALGKSQPLQCRNPVNLAPKVKQGGGTVKYKECTPGCGKAMKNERHELAKPNFLRPITWLKTQKKLFTECLTEVVADSKITGSKMILNEVRTDHRNLSITEKHTPLPENCWTVF